MSPARHEWWLIFCWITGNRFMWNLNQNNHFLKWNKRYLQNHFQPFLLGLNVLKSPWKKFPTQIARFLGPTWGPPWFCRPQVGPMNLAIRVYLCVASKKKLPVTLWGLKKAYILQTTFAILLLVQYTMSLNILLKSVIVSSYLIYIHTFDSEEYSICGIWQ